MACGLESIGAKTIAFCDIDPFCRKFLEKKFGATPVDVDRACTKDILAPFLFSNVTVNNWEVAVRPAIRDVTIDMIYGGFPCQDISVCGRGEGVRRYETDGQVQTNRSGLFYRLMEWVHEFKPTFVFLENVPAIRTRGLREVLEALLDEGYDCRWGVLSAFDVGYPHIRERWFLLACRQEELERIKRPKLDCATPSTLSHSVEILSSPVVRKSELPDVVADNLKAVHAALGNAVVPAQVRAAFLLLCGFEPSDGNFTQHMRATSAFKNRFQSGAGWNKNASRGFSIDTGLPPHGLPMCGQVDGSRTVYPHELPRRKKCNMNLWPTPTRTQRPSEGSARQLRRLVSLGTITWETAYVYNYKKCPCLSQGNLETWEHAGTNEHALIHQKLESTEFRVDQYVRNPFFVCELMGFRWDWFIQ